MEALKLTLLVLHVCLNGVLSFLVCSYHFYLSMIFVGSKEAQFDGSILFFSIFNTSNWILFLFCGLLFAYPIIVYFFSNIKYKTQKIALVFFLSILFELVYFYVACLPLFVTVGRYN